MNLSGLKDAELWTLFKKDDNQAFKFIYANFADKLYLYGLKICHDKALIEDVIQDLFTELVKNRKNLGDTDNILFYLLKAFKRKLLRSIQTEKRFVFHKDLEEYKFDVTWSIEHELILEEVSDRNTQILLNALNNLTPRQKEAIYLRFSKELDYKSVAEIMEISVEGCRNLISKAIRSLKTEMSGKGKYHLVLFQILQMS